MREAFAEIDYAQIHKQYATERAGAARYSPPRCTGCFKRAVEGDPDVEGASTSNVERSNPTLRMGSRRFTRLTNGFSKRFENHAHAVALHFWWYNFGRKHKTLKATPAVASGIASRAFSMLDLVAMIEEEEQKIGGRLTDYLPSPSK